MTQQEYQFFAVFPSPHGAYVIPGFDYYTVKALAQQRANESIDEEVKFFIMNIREFYELRRTHPTQTFHIERLIEDTSTPVQHSQIRSSSGPITLEPQNETLEEVEEETETEERDEKMSKLKQTFFDNLRSGPPKVTFGKNMRVENK